MSILVAADFTPGEWDAWLPLLSQAMPGEVLLRERDAALAREIDIAIVANPPRGALAGFPRLKLVQSLWAGVEGLLADPTLPAGVPLARMVDPAMNEAMAETALWAVLSLQREMFDYARQQREGRWLQRPQRTAGETTVAVLGLGQMGRAVALRLARNDYRVFGWSARPAAIEGLETRHGDAMLAFVLGAAQIAVNLLPLTSATRGLFDARRLALLPRGASFVNLARGAQVVEADLLAALDSGALRHAVLDVFAIEPLPAAHPFWAHPKVTLLPHVAAQTDPRSASIVAAANVAALRAGRALQHLVDRERGY
ncbi:MAG TPA: glyoxylate/hydroxypyruvate reductase A [Burkholderiaceae bacterium]|nr:glyoxylate/hydroxypyruvate reductase A [Burkholderiaceae bacterium]